MTTVQAPLLNGILPIDKPAGPTTYDLIRWAKNSNKNLKIGHAGTLDPLASGLVLLLFGKATKSQDRFMKKDKIYRFHVRLGIQTDSGDLAGKILKREENPTLPSETRIKEILQSMQGVQHQLPPMFSALKHKGQPLYKLARKGQVVERSPRQIEIISFDFLGFLENGDLDFRARVSSGTYIRTLAEDIGVTLGIPAVVSALCREAIGDFLLKDALEGERLNFLSPEEILHRILPWETYG